MPDTHFNAVLLRRNERLVCAVVIKNAYLLNRTTYYFGFFYNLGRGLFRRIRRHL